MSAKSPVDLVVGVDFGVAYAPVTKNSTPKVIQNWPGRELERNNKVPSSIVYEHHAVRDWGFKSQNVVGSRDWFKRYLDERRIERIDKRARRGERVLTYGRVKRWYKDYMHCLYAHLSKEIQDTRGDWRSKRVQFIFSVPCTYKEPRIGYTLLTLIKEAGFGSGGPRHTVELGLTEPEAAAVFTIRGSEVGIEAGTTMLICDAGGGTTDLAVLRTVTEDEDEPELEILGHTEGKNIGSMNIDTAFEQMINKRIAGMNPALSEDTAGCMMHSAEFLFWKCCFGQDGTSHYSDFPIKVPNVKSDFNHRATRIKNGKMLFSQEEFRNLFDPIVEQLIESIDTQIEVTRESRRDFKRPDYIVLSGGLGSSAYVRSELKDEFKKSSGHQVLVSEDPQLAVVKGLVIDRVQKLTIGKAVLKSRTCPVSYGVELSLLYDKEEHAGQDCYTSVDGKLYVKKQIVWLIRKGETIGPEGYFEKPGFKNFDVSDTKRIVHQDIWMSKRSPRDLPRNIDEGDARHVCRITFDLTSRRLQKLEADKRFLDFRSTKYYRADFETRFIVGAANLSFEVWVKGKKVGEENVSVRWQSS